MRFSESMSMSLNSNSETLPDMLDSNVKAHVSGPLSEHCKVIESSLEAHLRILARLDSERPIARSFWHWYRAKPEARRCIVHKET